ncbi:MAG: hypothetical protein ABIX11_13590 [Casimicrobiaceae bacterium]
MTDERDLRDPALDAAWRAQATDTPPPALDAAILAAAHRAVKSAPAKVGRGGEATRPWRWWTPLAAAAAIGAIAIGVLQLAPPEVDPTRAVVSDTPANVAATSNAPAPANAPVPPAVPSEAAEARAKASVRQERERAPAPQPFPAAPQAAKPAREADAVGRADAAPDTAQRLEQAAPRPPMQSAPAAAGGAAPAPALAKRAMRDEPAAQRSPDDWIARIRKALTEGAVAEAQRDLVAFRAAYADADARLPADLRPWAASVPRN